MQTSEINPNANYRNEDERLGAPGTYSGADVLAQIAAFGGEVEGDDEWELEEEDEMPAADVWTCDLCGRECSSSEDYATPAAAPDTAYYCVSCARELERNGGADFDWTRV